MRLMFVYWAYEDQGSGLVIQGYSEAAKALGHEVLVYGPPNPRIPLNYTRDLDSVDAVIFIFEWTTALQYGDPLDLMRVVARVPRERRIVIDCDGHYNDMIHVEGDYNHRDESSAQRWAAVCDSISDKVFVTSLYPRRKHARSFLFHAYNPSWERPFAFDAKEFGMIYLGHSKFRWRPLLPVLKGIEPIRDRVGRAGLVGYGWDKQPEWSAKMKMEEAYYVDYDYLNKLNVEPLAPVPFDQVINWMSKATFNPVIYRPLFKLLDMVTCRTFETVAAGTIPLFGLGEAYLGEVYGGRAVELAFDAGNARDKIEDMFRRPSYYADIVLDMRKHLAMHHSHAARLRQLIEIVKS